MKKKISKSEKIRALLKTGMSVAKVAKAVKVSANYVYQIRYKDGKTAKKASKKASKKWSITGLAVPKVEGTPVLFDSEVNTLNTLLVKADAPQVIPPVQTFIEDECLNYNLGCAVAFITDDTLDSLTKAAQHLNREIARRSAY